MTFTVGSMRDRVEIQSLTEVQDSFNEPIQTAATFATRWGTLEPLSGRETFEAAQLRGTVDHRITMRHLDGVTPKMRAVVTIGAKTRTFDIQAVLNPDERRRFTELLVSEEI